MANREAKPTPLVCTCGYDLAGLPASAAAKCPECGAVVDNLPPPRPLYLRLWVWGIAAIAPSVALYAIVLAIWALPIVVDLVALSAVLSSVAIALSWVIGTIGFLLCWRASQPRLAPYWARVAFMLPYAASLLAAWPLSGFAPMFAMWLTM